MFFAELAFVDLFINVLVLTHTYKGCDDMAEKRAMSIDTAAGATDDFLKNENVFLSSVYVVVDDRQYEDGVDLTKKEYYEIAKTAKKVGTAQPPAGVIAKRYEAIRDKGFDVLIDVHCSSEKSGIYQTSKLAASMVKGIKVYPIDTKNLSVGSFLQAREIYKRFIQEEGDLITLGQISEKIRDNVFFRFLMFDLGILARSGRMGRAQHLAGSILGIKPILTVGRDGVTYAADKVRTSKAGVKKIASDAREFLKTRKTNIQAICVYAFDKYREMALEVHRTLVESMKGIVDISNVKLEENLVWPSVGANSGLEGFGFGLYGQSSESI